MRCRTLAAVVALGLSLATSARAQLGPLELFFEGSELLRAGRNEEALAKLRASYDLEASPNSLLLIGRALAALDRWVDAAEAFDEVERDARRRVAAGETRYQLTLESAAIEGARAALHVGRVRVRAAGAPPGTEIEVAGRRRSLVGGDATFLHLPGVVAVTVLRPAEPPETVQVKVTAGGESFVDLVTRQAPPPPVVIAPPPTVPHDREHGGPNGWAIAAIGTGAAGAIALGLFAGFGLSNLSIEGDLEERCSPRCGAADEADRDRGEAHGMIANVSLGVGLGLAVASGVFTVLALTSGSGEAPEGTGTASRESMRRSWP
jgi:hypothetical protein